MAARTAGRIFHLACVLRLRANERASERGPGVDGSSCREPDTIRSVKADAVALSRCRRGGAPHRQCRGGRRLFARPGLVPDSCVFPRVYRPASSDQGGQSGRAAADETTLEEPQRQTAGRGTRASSLFSSSYFQHFSSQSVPGAPRGGAFQRAASSVRRSGRGALKTRVGGGRWTDRRLSACSSSFRDAAADRDAPRRPGPRP